MFLPSTTLHHLVGPAHEAIPRLLGATCRGPRCLPVQAKHILVTCRRPSMQDKRSVIAIELADVDAWLFGTVEDATSLVRVPPVDAIEAGPI